MNRLCLSLFCGIGGGSLGMSRAGFHTIGIDFDVDCVRDYRKLVGHDAHVLDLNMAQPHELRALVGEEAPEVVLLSPPCKAFSACLPVKTSKTDKYLELSSLAERGLWLVLEAWPEKPPRLILLENVPRIQSRGRQWLNEVAVMLNHYGYAWAETTHDCGELGALAQHRRRFLGVARHVESTPEWLYQPVHREMVGIGDVIGALEVPTTKSTGMHRLSSLSPMNWLRLALIPAGGDWRDLPDEVLVFDEKFDPRSKCKRRDGSLGVTQWGEQVHAVIGAASIQNTSLQVADPRVDYQNRSGAFGVSSWEGQQNTIIGTANTYHGQNTADPRLTCSPRSGAYGVSSWRGQLGTVVGAACHDNSAVSVDDPRGPSFTHALIQTERGIVLVGPPVDLKNSRARSSMVIRALDGTWHRPMTTLELALLQSFPADLEMCGRSHTKWRMRIGNAIPPRAAQAFGEQMMRTLDACDAAQFLMCASNVWVSEEQVCAI